MAKLTDKTLCDICERIVKIKRLQSGDGVTTDIFKAVKKSKALLKDLSPTGKKVMKELVKLFNAGKITLEEAIKTAEPTVRSMLSTKSGGAFTVGESTETIGSGAVIAGEGKPMEQNLPLGTSTSYDAEGGGAVIAGEGAVIAGEHLMKGKGKRFSSHSVGKGAAKVKVVKVKKPNKWLEHIKSVREIHPELSYKEAIIKAKESYKK